MITKINVDMDKRCKKCHKGGTVNETGLCMECISKGIRRGDYDEMLKKHLATPPPVKGKQ
jgi:hypothetical protein